MTYAPFNGWCPGSGRHLFTGTSYPYCLTWDFPETPIYQRGWAFCQKCGNVAHAPSGPGPCAAGGQHDLSNTYPYGLHH